MQRRPQLIEQFRRGGVRSFARPDQPFPMNPLFRPPPPLSDQTRSRIYSHYRQNPGLHTPRALAEHFGISIARVYAVLRLKSVQETLVAAGKPLHVDLAAGMDKMLGAKNIAPNQGPRIRPMEPVRESTVNPLKPFLLFLDEEEAFSPSVLLINKGCS